MNFEKNEWDFTSLTKEKNFEDKRIDWQKATKNFISKWKGRTDYLEDVLVLKEALDDYELWKRDYGAEYDEIFFYWLKTKIDENNSEIKAKFNSVEEFAKKIENDMAFFVLNIAKISKKNQKIFLNSDVLNEYKHFLEKLFAESKYLLSEKEEKILNLKSASSYSSWVKMTSGFLSKEERKVFDEEGKKVLKSYSELSSLISSKNKKVRDEAGKALNDILEKYVDVAKEELNAILADKKINDELRGMKRPDFARHLSDDIDSEVVDVLIKSVSSKFYISRRYYELKAKLLGQKKLEYHERNVEYGKVVKKFSYDDSCLLVENVFGKLDKKFVKIFKNFIDNGLIDVYPRKNKHSGAFCVHFLKKQPTYILLNHTDKLHDVLTFAHELGHGINNELMKEKQNSLNFNTPLVTAEVASTFMENFVLDELMNNVDDEVRLSLMMNQLNDDVSTIIRQVACYMFEQELHKNFREKGYLSKEEIGKLFTKHMKNYMGDFVEQSKGSENWWVYWSHIRNFFYNYSYASGLLISKSLQGSVKENPKFIENVKEFLSTGGSKSPRDIFEKIGINIADKDFWDKGLEEVERLLNETEKLAKELGKI
ncbi:MAG TPA: M3 family oligoendopeptidase [Nanoarchaeota archaeon]|nr:M3 family oligoendopeptidase [Nanoarchaeota archaeon]HIH62852.1 M3 family oligoendopeptidase [Nanoarchaeota archaeon]HIJ09167.1 M3 family oligoendopeptidase [Nanoarchaeota archaeon]